MIHRAQGAGLRRDVAVAIAWPTLALTELPACSSVGDGGGTGGELQMSKFQVTIFLQISKFQ